MELLILVVILVAAAFNIWLFVVGVQFLRTGTRAFRAYEAAELRRARAQGAVSAPPAPGQRPWTGR